MAKTDILFEWKPLCNSIFSYRIFLVRFQLNEIYSLCASQVKCSQWGYHLVVLIQARYFFRDSCELHFGKENSCRWREWSHHCSQGLRSLKAHFCEDSRSFHYRDCEHNNTSNNIHRFCFNSCIRNGSLWAVHHRPRLDGFPYAQRLLDLFWTVKFRTIDRILQESPSKAGYYFPRDECDEVWHHVLCDCRGVPCRYFFH
jgi:hypothetical protein